MYLVTQGRGRINQLGYDPKTSEYVYIHKGVEQWRVKGDRTLLNYFNLIRVNNDFIDEESMIEIPTYNVYEKYVNSCHKFELEEWKRMGI